MDAARLEKRLAREKKARLAAEHLLEEKSRALFTSNQSLLETTKALEHQSKELSAILDNTQAGVFLLNEEGRILRANQAGVSLFRYSEDEARHAIARDLLLAGEIEPSPEAEGVEKCNAQAKRADGGVFPITLVIAHLEIDGQPHTVWICRDQTAEVEAEKARAQLEHELAQAQKLESLGVMASGIAHEINTPVQYVTDNVKFLSAAADDLKRAFAAYEKLCARARECAEVSALASAAQTLAEDADIDYVLDELPQALEHAIDGLAQIAKIVGAVKTFSHPGKKEKTQADVNAILRDTITVSRNEWKYIAELETDFDQALPSVICFSQELSQVFVNLIVNAAHAIKDNEVPSGRITVKTRTIRDGVQIEIADNGCGISPEIQAKVFDPFFTTKDVGKGTGQGLSLCHNVVVQHHGGRIYLESTPGEGTQFFVELPLAPSVTPVATAT